MQSSKSRDLYRLGRYLRGALLRFATEERGFAAAEAVLLALLLTSISIVVGAILHQAAVAAAQNLNNELAGTPTGSP
jgi:hypothetical protein